MRIIDLINMRAEGKEMPKKIRIEHWCYKFEWIEHESNYYDRNAEIDLMSCLSMDKEELNYEVEIIEEDKKIGKITINDDGTIGFPNGHWTTTNIDKAFAIKINEIINKVNSLENEI